MGIPETAIKSAAEFVSDWAKQQKHTEGVSDCCHCNGNFLAIWAENLLKERADHLEALKVMRAELESLTQEWMEPRRESFILWSDWKKVHDAWTQAREALKGGGDV